MPPVHCENPDTLVEALIAHVGMTLIVGTPLAAGKPNHLLNAVYRRAKRDPELSLTILTALTLQTPKGKSDLERRFLGPFVERVFGNYPELEYELDRVKRLALPSNVRVIEFYFAPAKYKGMDAVQQDYVSSNYTHAARDIIDRGVNVLMQQVAPSEDGTVLSLSCNPDLSIDIMKHLGKRAEQGDRVACVAQVNDELPFMFGDAEVPLARFDFVISDPALNFKIFGPPKMAVSEVEHAIGFHVSTLVRDGGELQIGIGALGDAICHALLLRHERNQDYRDCIESLSVGEDSSELVTRLGGLDPFSQGLFAASEMLVNGFLALFERGVIRRRVYDDLALQRLLNAGAITEQVSIRTLDELFKAKAISSPLSQDFEYLSHFGILRPGLRYENGQIHVGSSVLRGSLSDPEEREILEAECLGVELRHGAVMHGGFFLGNQAFYQGLRDLPEEKRRLIRMRSIARINQLYGHEDLDRLHRRHARFINTCMMVTLSGAAVSDGLEDGTVISGVGGQYNFVAMAQELPDGHSILNLRSTRTSGGVTKSCIVWNYGHVTVPRHMRDIYVTEYGIAYVRGKTDGEIAEALIQVADSRFQRELIEQAQRAGKLRGDYVVPEAYRNNRPDVLAAKISPLKQRDLLPAFPLGCDFTDDELLLGKALKRLKAKTESKLKLAQALLAALPKRDLTETTLRLLDRMGLASPEHDRDRIARRLLIAELQE